jgi:hypothetical protein
MKPNYHLPRLRPMGLMTHPSPLKSGSTIRCRLGGLLRSEGVDVVEHDVRETKFFATGDEVFAGLFKAPT